MEGMRALAVVVVVTLIAAALILVMTRSRGKTHPPDRSVMADLRLRALQAPPEEIGASVSSERGETPFAIVMDIGMEKGTASLFAAMTGDASIYLSTGGGVIGGIGHENVRSAAIAFVREADHYRQGLVRTTEYPYPSAGQVRFYIRAKNGVYMAEKSERDLGEKRDPLWPLFYSGQEVISQLRVSAPEFGK